MTPLRPSILIASLLALALGAGATVAAQPMAPGADLAPPPPPGPRGDHPPPPPPPPPGASIRIERDGGGAVRLDVHCGPAETVKSCADTTLAVFDKVNAGAPAK